MSDGNTRRGIGAAQLGLAVNAVLACAKLLAGIIGHTYALVADAVESMADVVSSLVVWAGLRIASHEPDEEYPFGYGKAEALATAVVALMLLGAAVLIGTQASREIRTPHQTPAPWTLVVLVAVVATKWLMSRRVEAVGADIGSSAVRADAWHHLSDALTSAAAFVGISVALVGRRVAPNTRWESADDWAAVFAAFIIAYNGLAILRRASHELMDRAADQSVVDTVRRAAENVAGVLATEKIAARKTGMRYRVTLHVQADPHMSLRDAHVLGGKVKGAIRTALPGVESVLVHMESHEPRSTR